LERRERIRFHCSHLIHVSACPRDESGPVFDIQLVRRGNLPKALKRRITMNDEKVLCSNVLTIRFDQLEDNRVNWYVEPDDKVWETQSLSLIELAEELLSKVVFGHLIQAAIWSTSITSIPSLNLTPLITLAR
jgi:hypothetical protein